MVQTTCSATERKLMQNSIALPGVDRSLQDIQILRGQLNLHGAEYELSFWMHHCQSLFISALLHFLWWQSLHLPSTANLINTEMFLCLSPAPLPFFPCGPMLSSTNRLEIWGPEQHFPWTRSTLQVSSYSLSPSTNKALWWLRPGPVTHPPRLTYLLEGSFWRHRESNFLKDLPYFFIISLSSIPVSKVGGSFCKVNINTCSGNKT